MSQPPSSQSLAKPTPTAPDTTSDYSSMTRSRSNSFDVLSEDNNQPQSAAKLAEPSEIYKAKNPFSASRRFPLSSASSGSTIHHTSFVKRDETTGLKKWEVKTPYLANAQGTSSRGSIGSASSRSSFSAFASSQSKNEDSQTQTQSKALATARNTTTSTTSASSITYRYNSSFAPTSSSKANDQSISPPSIETASNSSNGTISPQKSPAGASNSTIPVKKKHATVKVPYLNEPAQATSSGPSWQVPRNSKPGPGSQSSSNGSGSRFQVDTSYLNLKTANNLGSSRPGRSQVFRTDSQFDASLQHQAPQKLVITRNQNARKFRNECVHDKRMKDTNDDNRKAILEMMKDL